MFESRAFNLLIGALLLAMVVSLSFVTLWDAIPGTFYRDGRGFPHGTGTGEYSYENGNLMPREWYFRGRLHRATWYKPDGVEIATEKYTKEHRRSGLLHTPGRNYQEQVHIRILP